MQSAITSKGQTTLPKAVRDHLGLKTGDRVKFFIHVDGSVVLLPLVPASSLRGMLKRPGQRTVTIREMDVAIASAAAEGFPRRKRR